MVSWILARYTDGPTHAANTTAGAYSAAASAQSAVHGLEERVQSLELACAGMWEMMKKITGCTDEQLVEMIREVDARDGWVDGKITVQTAGRTCPNCKRQILTKSSPKCIWCSAELPKTVFGT